MRERERETWISDLPAEVSYWKNMINGTYYKQNYVQGFMRRVQGIDIAPDYLHKYLVSAKRILDVGSGPASVLGGVLNGIQLDITAVDPLANEYNKLYEENNIVPLVKPSYGEGENLSHYISGKFDFIYSRNAIDHSYAPLKIFQNMLECCSDDGCIFIENSINEGHKQGYRGLHKWNFMPASGDLVLWTENFAYLLTKELDKNSYQHIDVYEKDTWVVVKITK